MHQYADIYVFTVKLLYMFRVSRHPSSGVLKTVTAASGTGHNTGTATSLQRGLIGTGLCESHKPVPIRPRWREVTVEQKRNVMAHGNARVEK